MLQEIAGKAEKACNFANGDRGFRFEGSSVLERAAFLYYASALNPEVIIPIEAKGRLNVSDVVRANLATGGRKYGLPWAVLALSNSIATVVLVRYSDNIEDKTRILQNLLPLLALVFSCPILFAACSYFSAVSRLRHNMNLRNELKYSFSDEGIAAEGPTYRSNLTWSGLHRIEETRHAFLLFHDKTVAQVLPKRFFSADGIGAFREIIRTNVKKVRLHS